MLFIKKSSERGNIELFQRYYSIGLVKKISIEKFVLDLKPFKGLD
jgi:hypothetical protein